MKKHSNALRITSCGHIMGQIDFFAVVLRADMAHSGISLKMLQSHKLQFLVLLPLLFVRKRKKAQSLRGRDQKCGKSLKVSIHLL